jgi:hypothetical protein
MPSKEILRVVDSMTPEDLIKVYRQDIPFIDYRLADARKTFSKCLYANRTEPYFFNPIEYRRKNGLNIVLQFFDKSNKYPQKQRLGEWLYMWFNYRGGISFLRPCLYPNCGLVVFFYTAHFVERYRERLLKDSTISKTEAFHLFLCNNVKKSFKFVPSEKYPTNGWMMSPDGLCFVEVKEDSFIIAKTFIPWNFLRKDQIVTMNEIGQEALAKGFELNIPWEMFSEEDLKY